MAKPAGDLRNTMELPSGEPVSCASSKVLRLVEGHARRAETCLERRLEHARADFEQPLALNSPLHCVLELNKWRCNWMVRKSEQVS